MKKIFNITFLGLTLVACIGFSSNNLKKSKNYTLASYTKIGNASTNLTSEAAKKIALNHAKVSENNATFTKIKLNTSNGKSVYNIQFFVNGKEYNYTIDANTGKVY
ncbi:PepSY domain-containing protein [Leptotrichia sp.]|jgi:propeptide pepSY amd peptidase M4|uniref:PepSY domain-containing protein n=1 Tax=Leptotrichia sp. TaxID=104608 RepID=UPI0017A9F479|nr:PepSY domain-containing protein [Leptotrichia sp.]MBB1534043.1 PepSY domain-containing protein [Leptotrichia sp.]